MSNRFMHPRSGGLLFAAATLIALAACADASPTAVSPADAPLQATLSPTTLALVSGAGPIGGLDSANPVSIDGGATFQPALIVTPDPFWGTTLPGSNWVAPQNPAAISVYRASFTLPAGFTAPSLSLLLHADNYATVRLNGNVIGAQPAADHYPNFQDPADAFGTSNAAYFQPGVNVLEIQVGNLGGPTALDYVAEVTYTRATFDGLCDLTRQLVPHHGVANSLCVKLEAAARAMARGNLNAASGSLQAYIHEVEAQRGKKIASAGADLLIAMALLLMP
jgi:hypothetical protein